MNEWDSLNLPGIGPGKVAIVLGGGGAIGARTVEAFAALGASVALVTRELARSTALAKASSTDSSGSVEPFAADMARSDELEQLVEGVTQRLGYPAFLVNSAALGSTSRKLADLGRAEISTLFDVNVAGAIEAIRAVAPAMRAGGGGAVVNVASIAAYRASSSGPAYGASKAALITLSRIIAAELGPDRIRVNSVSPGQTPTMIRTWDGEPGIAPPATSGSSPGGVPLGRRGRLEDYVGAILFLCSSLADYITGVDIPVEGGVRLSRGTAK